MSRDIKDLLEEKYYSTLTKILRLSDKYEEKHLFDDTRDTTVSTKMGKILTLVTYLEF